jgi:hypothetical protein
MASPPQPEVLALLEAAIAEAVAIVTTIAAAPEDAEARSRASALFARIDELKNRITPQKSWWGQFWHAISGAFWEVGKFSCEVGKFLWDNKFFILNLAAFVVSVSRGEAPHFPHHEDSGDHSHAQ